MFYWQRNVKVVGSYELVCPHVEYFNMTAIYNSGCDLVGKFKTSMKRLVQEVSLSLFVPLSNRSDGDTTPPTVYVLSVYLCPSTSLSLSSAANTRQVVSKSESLEHPLESTS
ncbi:hypothetical protein JTE90_007167 [Oedothorax gibbosus]|uniref:Uncharacterized protein n=1 Tax=Oedothorax gibbosus TaxID=931172 RepID=A0AAV6UY29_9ARAC|nr:hypothetical protein JTE90_007167 [Oedothorax gibbosus]